MSPQLVFDRKSLNPFGFIRTAVFVAKEYMHRRPDPRFACEYVQGRQRKLADAHLETLRRDGIVIIPGYFQGRQLKELQAAFERAVQEGTGKYAPDSLSNEDTLPVDRAILDAALDDFLLQIIGGYYGKRFGLGRASASRLFPSPAERYSSYQWHHDTRGRQIHMMLLLSDVTEKGQRMSYLRQSHNNYYDRFRGGGEGSRFEMDVSSDTNMKGRIIELAGPAGTVGLFDSNGLHTGNRNEHEGRDAMLFCYISYPRHFKAMSCRRADFEMLPPAKCDLLAFNPRCALID